MSGLTYNLHQSGKLIELEKKWGIQATQYLKDQNTRFADWIQ
jgi:polar amino acid transport system substrate-binding protein